MTFASSLRMRAPSTSTPRRVSSVWASMLKNSPHIACRGWGSRSSISGARPALASRQATADPATDHRAAIAETAPGLLPAYDALAALTARDTVSQGAPA